MYRLITAITISTLITACGSGGGAGDTSSPAAITEPSVVPSPEPTPETTPEPTPEPDYTPLEERLEVSAEDSSELYVAESFNFVDSRLVHLNLTVHDDTGAPAQNTLLKISRVANDITSWDDQRLNDAELLLTAQTDSNGDFARTLETASTVKKLLVEIQAVGINNRAMLSISGVSPVYVQHTFQ